MNFSPFTQTTPLKSVSLSRGGAVNLRNSIFRTNPDAAKANVGWVGTLLLAASASSLIVSGVASAAQYSVPSQRQMLQNDGSKLAAENGGNAVTVEIFSTKYIGLPNNGLIQDGALIVSGSLGGVDINGNRTFFGGSHSLFYGGSTPADVTAIVVHVSDNYKTNPTGSYSVNLSTLRTAFGSNGSLTTHDLFGAKLFGDIPGIASITIGSASNGTVVTHVGNGFSGTDSDFEIATNTSIPLVRDFQTLAWDAKVVSSSTVPGISDEFINSSAYGFSLPPRGNNGKLRDGDSNGPVVSNVVFNNLGRVESLTWVGIGVGQQGFDSPVGRNLYTEANYFKSADFINSFIVPEPTIAITLLGIMGFCLKRNKRKYLIR